ncbi:MAG TPA: CRISPR-associated protein Cas7 [Bacteroidales bacterium]|nr:CRISPR-associated protein Cas7 [Bacteroidales bacterium]
MNSFIYLRGLRHVDHSVFCVESGQKFYWDPVFSGIRVPYSSGQQVKRSILDAINNELRTQPSAVTFVFNVNNKGALGEGEVLSLCDPEYYDQILGGWMKAAKGGNERTLKRRSPFSISAMRPLHPLLGGHYSENITFDRSDKPELHKVIVRDSSGNPMTEEQIEQLLTGTDRSLYRKWIPDNSRATGLFIYDIAIDLRTLFCVSVNQLEPEISKEKIEELKEKKWIASKNVFGDCLVMPKEQREKAIPAIAKALINWQITSNQARTFSLMETLAVAISHDANKIAGAIRAKLIEESDKPKAKPIIDETAGADIFVALPCAAYIATEIESPTALQDAENKLNEMLLAYDYEKQLKELL